MLGFGQQQMDSLWYIRNESPINGNHLLGNSVTIGGVDTVNLSCNSKANNDIFVIFKDDSYYNSRHHSDSIKFRNSQFYTGSSKNKLHINADRKIKHLYFSNVYEGDDLPEAITVSNNSGTNHIEISPVTSSNILSANHTIRPGYDVTLIIQPRLENTILKLSIELQNGNDEQKDFSNYFSLMNFPNSNVSYIGGTVAPTFLNGNLIIPENVKFINLRARTFHSNGGFNLTTDKKAIFIGKNELLREVISDTNDPNFVELLSICDPLTISGFQYYTYKIQVENDGRETAEDVSLNIKLPFDFTAVAIESYLMGETYKKSQNEIVFPNNDRRTPRVTFTEESRSINFSFPNAKLCNCKIQNGRNKAIGYIVFTVKRTTPNTSEVESDVKFIEANSYMKTASASNFGPAFRIHEFKVDLHKQKDDSPPIVITSCNDMYKIKNSWIKPCPWYKKYFCNCYCNKEYGIFNANRYKINLK